MRTQLALAAAILFLSACPKPCSTDRDCDDGLFCNGPETCSAQVCTAGTAPSCSDGITCTIDSCSENLRSCLHAVPDVDGDGQGDAKCLDLTGVSLGQDCDDHDARRATGFREVCDDGGVDEDCDETTVGRKDTDNDGYVDAVCTNVQRDGGINRGPDCDDTNEGVHPGQLEACNGRDDNCNGLVDEGVKVNRYADLDNDGWGAGLAISGCLTDPGTSHLGTDCDDANAAMHPGAFRCVPGGQGLEYELCQPDGGYFRANCPAQGVCRAQPNGTGLCL